VTGPEKGAYLKDIAAELGVHLKTVSRALAHGAAPGRRPWARRSKLDPAVLYGKNRGVRFIYSAYAGPNVVSASCSSHRARST
jgi:hypothetical protein